MHRRSRVAVGCWSVHIAIPVISNVTWTKNCECRRRCSKRRAVLTTYLSEQTIAGWQHRTPAHWMRGRRNGRHESATTERVPWLQFSRRQMLRSRMLRGRIWTGSQDGLDLTLIRSILFILSKTMRAGSMRSRLILRLASVNYNLWENELDWPARYLPQCAT